MLFSWRVWKADRIKRNPSKLEVSFEEFVSQLPAPPHIQCCQPVRLAQSGEYCGPHPFHRCRTAPLGLAIPPEPSPFPPIPDPNPHFGDVAGSTHTCEGPMKRVTVFFSLFSPHRVLYMSNLPVKLVKPGGSPFTPLSPPSPVFIYKSHCTGSNTMRKVKSQNISTFKATSGTKTTKYPHCRGSNPIDLFCLLQNSPYDAPRMVKPVWLPKKLVKNVKESYRCNTGVDRCKTGENRCGAYTLGISSSTKNTTANAAYRK